MSDHEEGSPMSKKTSSAAVMSLVEDSPMVPAADQWQPRHLHQVVGVTMVIRNWMRPRDQLRERLKAEVEAATREVNASLVFEPMSMTMERLRTLHQLGARTSSHSSLLSGLPGTRPGSKLSSVSQAASGAIAEQQVAEQPPDHHQQQQQHLIASADQPPPPAGPPLINGSARRVSSAAFAHPPLPAIVPVPTMRSRIRRWRTIIGTLFRSPVDPTGPFYGFWTCLVYLVFLYNAIGCVLFVFDDTGGAVFAVWGALNAIGDMVNLADILVNSRLSFLEDGMLVVSLRRLAKRYFRSAHFAFDAAALLPTDLLLLLDPNLSLVRVNRLAKCYRVWEFVQMTNVRTNYPNAFRILHILVVCVVLFHWNAALYFKISLIHGIFSLDFTAWEFNYVKNQDPVWVQCGAVLWANVPEGMCMFNESGRGDPDTERPKYIPEMAQFWQNRSSLLPFSNFSKQYSLSFYWSSLTLTTSGQQPYPTAAMHNFLEIFDTIVGVLVFAVIVGSVGNVVTTMNRGRTEIQQLNDGIKFYMHYRNVSDAMQKRVLDCIHYIRRHAQVQDEQAILHSIPPRLRGELAVHLHMETLRAIDLFADCEPSLLYELVLRLKMQMFAPNDFLCRRGDLAREMFVLKRGVLEVIGEVEAEPERLMTSGAFGEMSILKPIGPIGKVLARRNHSLRSLGYSEVYLLSQEDAVEVFGDYPEERQALIDKATHLLLESGALHGDQLVQPGPLVPLELCGTESAGEVLQLLDNTLRGLDAQLDTLYDRFTTTTSEMKQRMSQLEDTYQQSRHLLRQHKRK